MNIKGSVSNYSLYGKLGEGGFGKVFLGCPKDDPEDQVAVKFCFGDAKEDAVREFEMLKKLDHDNCLGVDGDLDQNAILDYKDEKTPDGVSFATDLCFDTILDIIVYTGPFSEDLARCYFR